MRTSTTAAALAVLAVAACSKPAEKSASVQAGSANGTADATAAVQAKGSDIVDKIQDSAAAVVGPISAATAGSLNAKAFVENAAMNDMYETESSKMALTRSKSPGIKKFAQGMITAHAKTTAQLKALVSSGKAGEGVTLPTALDNRRQGLIDDLKSASADDFDARYVDQQGASHREAEILMNGYGAAGQNADLKAFAKETAPKVTAHRAMVVALDKKNADGDSPSHKESNRTP